MAKLPDGSTGNNHGITVSMVGATLGTTSKDVGRLCTNQNINMWSKWKPVSYPILSGIDSSILHAVHYGLEWPTPILMGGSSGNSYFTRSTAPKMMKPDAKWKYNGPTGGASSPYRLGDFRNYLHNSYPPVGSTYSRTWDDKPRTLEYSVTPDMAYVNLRFETPDSQDDHDLTYNLTFDDFTFMVANEGQQSEQLNMDGTRLMIAVFPGHIDPFKTAMTTNQFPEAADWIWIIHDTPIKQDGGLNFHLKASALTGDNSFDVDTTEIGQLTLVFMLGVGYEAHIANSHPRFRLYDHSTYNNGTAPYAPPYCMALPFDNQHYPVVWLDEYVNPNKDAIYFNVDPDEDTVWWKRFYDSGAASKWNTYKTTASNAVAIGGKMWWDTADGVIALYGGNTDATPNNYRICISILMYNKGTSDFNFIINDGKFVCKSSRADVASNPINYLGSSTVTIPAKGSARVNFHVSGVYVPTTSRNYNGKVIPPENELTFTYIGGSQTYNLGKIKFVGTTDPKYDLSN